jgi:hypothetical protein
MNFAAVDCVPCWTDLGPRLGASYDLCGTGRTALNVIGHAEQGDGRGARDGWQLLGGSHSAARVPDALEADRGS